MAIINSRDTLAEYCLRKLGAPVLDIAIDDDQISDCIEDALEFFKEFHYDSVERMYLRHQVTGNAMSLSNPTVFLRGEIIQGSISGAMVKVLYPKDSSTLWVDYPQGTFSIGETVTGLSSGSTGVVTDYLTGDMENGFIPCADAIQGVKKVFPISAAVSTNSVFDLRFQLKMSDLYSLQSAQIVQYEQVQQHLSTIEMLLVGDKQFRFNKQQGRITIDMNWRSDVTIGQYVVVECYRALDPEQYTKLYNERSLKRLCTAYISRQWGQNLKLFSGVTLPGNVSINGQQIYDAAVLEVEAAEQHIISTYQLPCGMAIG